MVHRSHELHDDRRRWIAHVAFFLVFVAASFLFQSAVYTSAFRPDEYKAVPFFIKVFAPGPHTPGAALWARFCLFLFDLAVTLALFAGRLVHRHTLTVALLWPLTVFLFSRLYWEFFVFPLFLVRIDLKARHELGFIAVLGALLWFTGEANIGVLMGFRAVLLLQKSGSGYLVPACVAALAVLLDLLMNAGTATGLPLIGGHLARFDWIRDIVNPEYSPLETVFVFLASLHFFSLHDGSYWIDAVFSVLVILLILGSSASLRKIRSNLPIILAFIATVFFFTHVTHAFQNARYYYFVVPVIASVTHRGQYAPLGVLAVLHVVFRSFAL